MADHVTRLFTHGANESSEDAEQDNLDNSNAESKFEIVDRISVTIENMDSEMTETNVSEPLDKKQDSSKEDSEEPSDRLFLNVNPNPEDSGLFSAEVSKKESGSSESSGDFPLSEDTAGINNDRSPALDVSETERDDDPEKMTLPQGDIALNSHSSSSHVCVKLCTLIKAQLVLAHAEVYFLSILIINVFFLLVVIIFLDFFKLLLKRYYIYYHKKLINCCRYPSVMDYRECRCRTRRKIHRRVKSQRSRTRARRRRSHRRRQ